MKAQKFKSVWDAIEDNKSEASSMKARSEIMIALYEKVSALNMTQAKSAELLGITQPRLSDLLQGKVNKFSLDALFDLAERANLKPIVKFKKAA